MIAIKNRPVNLLFVSLVVCFLCCTLFINADENHRSNCNVSYECDTCKVGQYKRIKIGSRYVKVCCPNCSEYFDAGNKKVGNESVPYCSCYSLDDITGDCWKGEECKSCQQGPYNDYVGSINTIPVCCKNCEKSGLVLGLKLCECLHNGP